VCVCHGVRLLLAPISLDRSFNRKSVDLNAQHLGEFPLDLLYGYYTFREKPGPRPIDIGMIEATAILEDGSIVPGQLMWCWSH